MLTRRPWQAAAPGSNTDWISPTIAPVKSEQVQHVRAFWAARQGMGGAMAGAKPADVLGRIVGLWDWDGIAGELVWMAFDAGAKKAIAAAAKPFADFVTKELGDVRSFSLDSPESRGDRIAALRAAAVAAAKKR